MVRYPFIATMSGAPTFNADGDPIGEGDDIVFDADFQPNAGGVTVKYAGSFVDVSYKLFVPPTNKTVFTIGTEVTCNNVKGAIVSIFPTKFNTEIWVK